jgi:hypothetical protein
MLRACEATRADPQEVGNSLTTFSRSVRTDFIIGSIVIEIGSQAIIHYPAY